MTSDEHDATRRGARTIAGMPQADFVEIWEILVGEPPAVMLDDRRDMISILVATTEVAPAYEGRAGAPGAAPRARLARRRGG